MSGQKKKGIFKFKLMIKKRFDYGIWNFINMKLLIVLNLRWL